MSGQHLTGRAGYASWNSWVKFQPLKGDIVAAIGAIAVFAILHTGKSGVDAQGLLAAPRLGGFGHRLLLQSVHAAKATNGLLIKWRGFLAILRNVVLREECFAQILLGC